MEKSKIDRIIESVRSYLYEMPVNNVGGGQIAGTVEAGDDPPVRKKKKKYMSGGRGSRKMWLQNLNGRNS
jgi:hypothetical protein